MMKVEFYKSKVLLDVVDYEIVRIRPKFHREVTTLLINKKFHLSQRDRLTYDCEKCGKIVKRIFAFNTLLLCKKCRTEDSCLNKYGVSHPLKLEEIREKTKRTNLKRYGIDCILRDRKKKEDGMMWKFGVKHSMQNSELREKSKRTCISRYGVPYTLQSKEIQQKRNQTNIEKYGEKNPFRFGGIFFKKEMMRRYGVDNVRKSSVVKEKIAKNRIDTMISRYGVSNPMQIPEIAQKVSRSKSGIEIQNKCKWFDVDGQRVQGNFEVKVANFLTENSIRWIAHKGISSIQYKDIDSKNRYYNPDFYLPELDVYLEPRAKYFWNEKFSYKIEQCKRLGYSILTFDEDMPLCSILEHIGAV
jgi:hypothetical protein